MAVSIEPIHGALSAGLYIVATPIGNLGDVTMRAVDAMQRCDVIACEDSRVTGKLLKHLGIRKPLYRYNDHSDQAARARLIRMMHDQSVVLVSDAGTPLISDPGYRLVQDAREAGVSITSLPGACAAIVGLTLSGLPNDRFLFAGFLPAKDQARKSTLTDIHTLKATVIFYETGPRLVKSLEAIGEVLAGRTVSVARELTKVFEDCRTGTAETLAAHYRDHPAKGEIVLMVSPALDGQFVMADADALLREALMTDKPSRAAGKVAKATGLDRKALYARAAELRAE